MCYFVEKELLLFLMSKLIVRMLGSVLFKIFEQFVPFMSNWCQHFSPCNTPLSYYHIDNGVLRYVKSPRRVSGLIFSGAFI